MEKKLSIKEEANLGLKLCEEGKLEEGIKHLKIAAEANNLSAIVNLGHALKLFGDYDEAYKWTLRGASLNHKTAISNLCIMLRRGQGCECNVLEAVKWGQKLIDLGDYVDGYNEIICSYLYAEDEYQQDFDKAFEYAKKATDLILKKNPKPSRDECEVIIQLALCYDFGKGIEKNQKEALKYYEYCAKQGIGHALYNAAYIYAYSEDKELKNISRALDWFKEAADKGYGDGDFQLGYLYHTGDIAPKDLKKAEYYYSKALRDANLESQIEYCKDNLKEISEETLNRVLSGKYCSIID